MRFRPCLPYVQEPASRTAADRPVRASGCLGPKPRVSASSAASERPWASRPFKKVADVPGASGTNRRTELTNIDHGDEKQTVEKSLGGARRTSRPVSARRRGWEPAYTRRDGGHDLPSSGCAWRVDGRSGAAPPPPGEAEAVVDCDTDGSSAGPAPVRQFDATRLSITIAAGVRFAVAAVRRRCSPVPARGNCMCCRRGRARAWRAGLRQGTTAARSRRPSPGHPATSGILSSRTRRRLAERPPTLSLAMAHGRHPLSRQWRRQAPLLDLHQPRHLLRVLRAGDDEAGVSEATAFGLWT